MAARSHEEAIDEYLERLRGIASCITMRPILDSGYRLIQQPRDAGFALLEEPVRLRSESGNSRLQMVFRSEYIVEQRGDLTQAYQVRIAAYYHRILAADGHEILAYHWRHEGQSAITDPHLHLSNQVRPSEVGRGNATLALADLHLTTGQVMLIDECKVEPLVDNWQQTRSTHTG